ncbi:response regulator transcription factor [Alteromonadaceae bacterium M269]|nr:response regulator transcription factor [Alteromonadaceae bacterium M269]
MRVLKVLIAEDEVPALKRLKRQLSQLPYIDVIGHANTGLEALLVAKTLDADVMLLDIQMPGINGIEVAKQLNDRCLVIYTTAYKQYAVEAFEHAAVDYLLKPYSISRLEEALSRARQRLNTTTQIEHVKRIKVSIGKTDRYFSLNEVTHFSSFEGVTMVNGGHGCLPIDTTLSAIEVELPDYFVRVHRNAIVNIHKIIESKRQLNGTLSLRLLNQDSTVLTSRNGARKLRTSNLQ